MKTENLSTNDSSIDAVDILNNVTSSLDYLEDVSEERVSSLLTILHSEIDRAIELISISSSVSLQCSDSPTI